MYRSLKVCVIAPCWNEESKIGTVISRIKQTEIADEIVVVDDGSSDNSPEISKSQDATVIRLNQTLGVGAALREGFQYARKNFDVIVVIAGNNKDEPKEIPRLLDPIADGKAVFVQGSRFLASGGYGGDMPGYRKLATRLHPLLFSLATGRHLSESTNGFRAFRTDLLDDTRIQLDQRWLDGYELEPYLLYKVITLGHAHFEVPVTKIYPSRTLGYTKMKPIRDWWNILRPIVLLRLGLKH